MKRDKTNDDKEEKCEMRDGREKVEEEDERNPLVKRSVRSGGRQGVAVVDEVYIYFKFIIKRKRIFIRA